MDDADRASVQADEDPLRSARARSDRGQACIEIDADELHGERSQTRDRPRALARQLNQRL